MVWFGSDGMPLDGVRFSGRNGFGAAFFSSRARFAFATSASWARSAFVFRGVFFRAIVFAAVPFAIDRFGGFFAAAFLDVALPFAAFDFIDFFALRFVAFFAVFLLALAIVTSWERALLWEFLYREKRSRVLSRGTTPPRPAVLNRENGWSKAMNNNGLAMIVGGLAVIVAVFIYFGTDILRDRGDGDIDVTIEAPAAPSTN